MFIRIEKNPDGSHAFQAGGSIENGWAFVPPEIAIPDTFPFVNIEVEEVFHPAVTSVRKVEADGEEKEETIIVIPEFTQMEVVSMTEGVVVEEEIVAETTTDDVLNALLGVK